MEKKGKDSILKAFMGIPIKFNRDMENWHMSAIDYTLQKFGKDPWIRKKKRCPKCSSDKWKKIRQIADGNVFDVLEKVAIGIDSTPHLIEYKCNKCGEEFTSWEFGDFFDSMVGNCKCKEKPWVKLCEGDDFYLFKCARCKAVIGIEKEAEKRREVKSARDTRDNRWYHLTWGRPNNMLANKTTESLIYKVICDVAERYNFVVEKVIVDGDYVHVFVEAPTKYAPSDVGDIIQEAATAQGMFKALLLPAKKRTRKSH